MAGDGVWRPIETAPRVAALGKGFGGGSVVAHPMMPAMRLLPGVTVLGWDGRKLRVRVKARGVPSGPGICATEVRERLLEYGWRPPPPAEGER